jgi:hypothetical protein
MATLAASYKAHTVRYAPVLPAVFIAYHMGYGYGFLRGILDFCIRRRGLSLRFVQITRASPGV